MSYKILFCQGGLGDHLSFSTLPEEWNKQGYDVFLSYYNVHRNLEVNQLVWDTNPYINGYINEAPFTSEELAIQQSGKILEERKLSGEGFIESRERLYGILNSGNKIPKIYRNHNIIPSLQGKTIINLQSITSSYDEDYVLEKLDQIIYDLGISSSEIFQLKINSDVNTFKNNFNKVYDVKEINVDYEKYEVNNIFEHCDLINSCENYITLFSGGAVLASAVNNPNTFVIMGEFNRYNYETKNFIFPNQNYIF